MELACDIEHWQQVGWEAACIAPIEDGVCSSIRQHLDASVQWLCGVGDHAEGGKTRGQTHDWVLHITPQPCKFRNFAKLSAHAITQSTELLKMGCLQA